MLSAEGCQRRRERLWQRLEPKPTDDYLLLADPIHLMYLANCWIDPFSLGTDFGAFLLLRKDGHATLIYDKRSPHSVEQAHVDERRVVNWGFSVPYFHWCQRPRAHCAFTIGWAIPVA